MLSGCTPWPEDAAARYRAAGYWTGETLGAFLGERAARFGPRTAVVGDGRRWTYTELHERAERLASALAGLGIAPGDRVVVQLPNVPEVFEVVFALFRLGALPVYALPAHRSAEVGHLCAASGAVALVVAAADRGFDYPAMADAVRAATPGLDRVIVCGAAAPEAAPIAPAAQDPAPAADRRTLAALRAAPGPAVPPPPGDAGEVAFLQLSGGTTGLPKLIPRTHDDYLYSVRASAEICALSPDTVYLGALPIVHNFPMSSPGFLGVLHTGGTVVLAPDPSPATCLALVESERVTLAAVVPPVAMLWLDAVAGGSQAHRDLSSLRTLQVGGAKFAEEAARRVRPVLGCRVQQVFGMAEGLVNYTRPEDDADTVATTQGRPISPHDEVRIVDDADRPVEPGAVGHLLTRGPYTIRGYYDAPEHNAAAFTADGFYRTGDLVRATPTGHLVVEGRAKDQINRGGEKIAAEEVENHLLAHPGVLDAALVAVPDPYLGERTCAYVVARGTPQTSAALRGFLRGRGLAGYKIPDRVELVDRLPATAVGKVSRRDLRGAPRPDGTAPRPPDPGPGPGSGTTTAPGPPADRGPLSPSTERTP